MKKAISKVEGADQHPRRYMKQGSVRFKYTDEEGRVVSYTKEIPAHWITEDRYDSDIIKFNKKRKTNQ